MTDNDIIKAFMCCHSFDESCGDCPYKNGDGTFCSKLLNDVLDLVIRQQAEIERLQKEVEIELDKLNAEKNDVMYYKDQIKTEAVKEFADKLKEKISNSIYEYWNFGTGGYYLAEDVEEDIDNLVKEMVGDVSHKNTNKICEITDGGEINESN